MALSLGKCIDPGFFGLKISFSPEKSNQIKFTEKRWRNNPIFRFQRKNFNKFLNINYSVSNISCVLSANNKKYHFKSSKTFTLKDLKKSQDIDIFPDYPLKLSKFKFLELNFIENQSQTQIQAIIKNKEEINYTFQPSKNPDLFIKCQIKEQPEFVQLNYNFINKNINQFQFSIQISENKFIIKLRDKLKKEVNFLWGKDHFEHIYLEQKVNDTIQTSVELRDLQIIKNYFQLFFDKNSIKPPIINPYKEFANTSSKKKDLKQLLNKFKNLKILIDFLNEYSKVYDNIHAFLKLKEIKKYSIMNNFYSESDFQNENLISDIHVYLTNSNDTNANKLEEEFESKFNHDKENHYEFAISFWAKSLE